MRPTGFISNTLGQGVTGMIYGTWTIAGNVVTLNVESSDERIVNRTTTGTIEKFRENEIVVKSSNGTVTTFVRCILGCGLSSLRLSRRTRGRRETHSGRDPRDGFPLARG